MIVIAIIAVVASFAIPNLIASRKGANEGAAVAALKAIYTAQQMHQQRFDHYAEDIGTLASEDLLDSGFADDSRQGYEFLVVGSTVGTQRADGTVGEASSGSFSVLARPLVFDKTGDRQFLIDETGTVYYSYSQSFDPPKNEIFVIGQ